MMRSNSDLMSRERERLPESMMRGGPSEMMGDRMGGMMGGSRDMMRSQSEVMRPEMLERESYSRDMMAREDMLAREREMLTRDNLIPRERERLPESMMRGGPSDTMRAQDSMMRGGPSDMIQRNGVSGDMMRRPEESMMRSMSVSNGSGGGSFSGMGGGPSMGGGVDGGFNRSMSYHGNSAS